MKVPFYGHQRQYESIKSEIDAKMQEVITSGSYVQGPMLKKFEQELAEYAGAKYAIGVGNGTDAIWLTFMALGLGKGDEIITNANTFFATAEAIWIAGATAVFVVPRSMPTIRLIAATTCVDLAPRLAPP